ncbi:hypothetical protein [Tenggerimyces flavus]|uniref:Uncharacterized protein n=1 Tax=Tenggerimyces flavus TaxID=1708749 RepID=A0ABV7YAH7_9ACTN|nr:hypothetical protein [Tenggerimyces flavus]MBM7783749.1 hypothetical protein [Tenggerimyces flavus]
MNRVTSINIASGLAVFGVTTIALAAPAAARPYDPESRFTHSTKCIGDEPLNAHLQEYLPLCPPDDLAAETPPGWDPVHVAAGAGGGIVITCLAFTGALTIRRNRRHQLLVPSASDSNGMDVLER